MVSQHVHHQHVQYILDRVAAPQRWRKACTIWMQSILGGRLGQSKFAYTCVKAGVGLKQMEQTCRTCRQLGRSTIREAGLPPGPPPFMHDIDTFSVFRTRVILFVQVGHPFDVRSPPALNRALCCPQIKKFTSHYTAYKQA